MAMVKFRTGDAGDALFARSRWVAATACIEGPNVVAQLHWPRLLAVTVQMVPAPSVTTTVAKGSEVPEMVGFGPTVAACAGLLMTGAMGAVVSTVIVRGPDTTEAFPAGSVAMVVNVIEPSGRVEVVHVHTPLPCARAVQTVEPATITRTVLPGSAVPEMVGVAVPEKEPSAGVVKSGAPGAVVSLEVGRVVLPVPAKLVCAALTLIEGPSVKAATFTEVEKVPLLHAVDTTTLPTVTVTMPAVL